MPVDASQLRSILRSFVPDSAQLEEAIKRISDVLPVDTTAHVDGADVDLDRERRCGFPEVVFAEGKPADLIVEILKAQRSSGQLGFATRVNEEQAAAILAEFPKASHNGPARTIRITSETHDSAQASETPLVAVVSAGSCDAPAAQEAIETLRWMNVPSVLIEDIGVAGPQRLLKHVPILQQMHAIVCVAGMEAALPSVVGGHVGCPVIGVPTSVGYGASFGGVTALLSMLTCCASNVVTVNIDAGFRGGYVAGMIARNATRIHD